MITTPTFTGPAPRPDVPVDGRPERTASADSQPVGVLLHDSGRILAVNGAGAQLFGRPSAQLLHTHLSDWVSEDARIAFTTALEGGLASSRKIRITGPGGSPLRLEMVPQGWLTYQARLVQMVLVRAATAGAGTDRWVGKAGRADSSTGGANATCP